VKTPNRILILIIIYWLIPIQTGQTTPTKNKTQKQRVLSNNNNRQQCKKMSNIHHDAKENPTRGLADFWHVFVGGKKLFFLNELYSKKIFYCPINYNYPVAFRPSTCALFYADNIDQFVILYSLAFQSHAYENFCMDNIEQVSLMYIPPDTKIKSLHHNKACCAVVFAIGCIYIQRIINYFNEISISSTEQFSQEVKEALCNNKDSITENLTVCAFITALLYMVCDKSKLNNHYLAEYLREHNLLTPYGAEHTGQLVNTFIELLQFNLTFYVRELDNVIQNLGPEYCKSYKNIRPIFIKKCIPLPPQKRQLAPHHKIKKIRKNKE
jgi:hypothetical protein